MIIDYPSGKMNENMNGDHKAEDRAPFTGNVDPGFGGSTSAAAPANKPLLSAADMAATIKIYTKDRKKLKKFLRDTHLGADHEARTNFWWELANAKSPMNGNTYKDMLLDLFGDGDSYEPTLPSFVDPGHMDHYHLTTQGATNAKRLMCVLGKSRPDIAYAPTLLPLASLLLHYMDEDKAYEVLEVFLHSRNYSGVRQDNVPQTKVAYEAGRYVLKELARKYAKSCFQFILKSGGEPIERVLDNWMWWILRDLPFSYMLRVIDCFFYEGPKVLYRVALAIMILFHKTVKGSPSSDLTISSAISQFCEDIQDVHAVSVDQLLKTAFGIRGLSRKEIKQRMTKSEMIIKSLSQNVYKASLQKSPSCESLSTKVKVIRTFSLQEIAGSTILDASQWDHIWQWIPPRFTVMVPKMIYTTAQYGFKLATFFEQVEGYEQTLIIIKAVTGEVFGAYCSTDWAERHDHKLNLKYIGTGEMFLFSIAPKAVKYEWAGVRLGADTPTSAHLFMAGDTNELHLGGGNGIGIRLDDMMDKCLTDKCDTFGNPPFVDGKFFQVADIEVFTLE